MEMTNKKADLLELLMGRCLQIHMLPQACWQVALGFVISLCSVTDLNIGRSYEFQILLPYTHCLGNEETICLWCSSITIYSWKNCHATPKTRQWIYGIGGWEITFDFAAFSNPFYWYYNDINDLPFEPWLINYTYHFERKRKQNVLNLSWGRKIVGSYFQVFFGGLGGVSGRNIDSFELKYGLT